MRKIVFAVLIILGIASLCNAEQQRAKGPATLIDRGSHVEMLGMIKEGNISYMNPKEHRFVYWVAQLGVENGEVRLYKNHLDGELTPGKMFGDVILFGRVIEILQMDEQGVIFTAQWYGGDEYENMFEEVAGFGLITLVAYVKKDKSILVGVP